MQQGDSNRKQRKQQRTILHNMQDPTHNFQTDQNWGMQKLLNKMATQIQLNHEETPLSIDIIGIKSINSTAFRWLKLVPRASFSRILKRSWRGETHKKSLRVFSTELLY